MECMDKEQDMGVITTFSATMCMWWGHQISIINTSGLVNFTLEVEHSLRILDGAIPSLAELQQLIPRPRLPGARPISAILHAYASSTKWNRMRPTSAIASIPSSFWDPISLSCNFPWLQGRLHQHHRSCHCGGQGR